MLDPSGVVLSNFELVPLHHTRVYRSLQNVSQLKCSASAVHGHFSLGSLARIAYAM